MTQAAENPVLTMPEDIDDNIRILQLVAGQIDGEHFWAYVAMYPTKYQEYYEKVAAGEPVVLDDFGETLEKGWGKEPPEDIVALMAEDYGADPHFEDDLKQAAQEALEQEAMQQDTKE